MNKQNTILFSILFSLFFLAFNAQAQEWNFEKDSILITISNKTIGSTNCVNLHASMNVTCSFQKAIQTLKDYDNYQSWYYSCVESRELTKQKDNIQYFYTMSQIPFLLNYRDAVFKAEYFDSPKKYNIKISSLPEYIPEIEDISRMQFAEGEWEICELSTKNISIKYQFIIDPGFTVPLFLVHQKLAKTPYNTFSNLKKNLQNIEN